MAAPKKSTLFLRNLHHTVKSADIVKAFQDHSGFVSAKLDIHRDQPKGAPIGFVTFDGKANALGAVQSHDDSLRLRYGTDLRITLNGEIMTRKGKHQPSNDLNKGPNKARKVLNVLEQGFERLWASDNPGEFLAKYLKRWIEDNPNATQEDMSVDFMRSSFKLLEGHCEVIMENRDTINNKLLRTPSEQPFTTMKRSYVFDALRGIWAALRQIQELSDALPELFPHLPLKVYTGLHGLKHIRLFLNDNWNTPVAQADQVATVHTFLYGAEFDFLRHAVSEFKNDWESTASTIKYKDYDKKSEASTPMQWDSFPSGRQLRSSRLRTSSTQ